MLTSAIINQQSDIRKLARQDSNLDCQYQKLECCHYTTGQRGCCGGYPLRGRIDEWGHRSMQGTALSRAAPARKGRRRAVDGMPGHRC